MDHPSALAPNRHALEPPEGLRALYVAVGGGSRACALTTESTLRCWTGEGGDGPVEVPVPEGEFAEVSMHPRGSEVLLIDVYGNSVPCPFGEPELCEGNGQWSKWASSITGGTGEVPPLWLERKGWVEWYDRPPWGGRDNRDPVGQSIHDRLAHWPYGILAASDHEVCALAPWVGTVDCIRDIELAPVGHYSLEGKYSTMDLGDDYNCAIEADSYELYCWGPDLGDLPAYPLPGVDLFTISVGIRGGCGVTLDGAIECWTRDGPPDDFAPAE